LIIIAPLDEQLSVSGHASHNNENQLPCRDNGAFLELCKATMWLWRCERRPSGIQQQHAICHVENLIKFYAASAE